MGPAAQPLSGSFQAGTVTILPTTSQGYEADVDNNGVVDLRDVVRLLRMAFLDEPPADDGEFQRADCAPTEARGDGLLNLLDGVVGINTAGGLLPLVTAGGPTRPAAADVGPFDSPGPADEFLRTIRLGDCTLARGLTNSLALVLSSDGDVNALSCSLVFPSDTLSFHSIALSESVAGSLLILNTNEAAQGKLGMALLLPAGSSVAAGTQEVAKVLFTSAKSAAVGVHTVGFTDEPVTRMLADTSASLLDAGFVNGKVTIVSSPFALLAPERLASGAVRLRIQRIDGLAFTEADLAEVQILTAGTIAAPTTSWHVLNNGNAVLTNGVFQIEDSGKLPMRFYRLRWQQNGHP